MIAIRTWLNRGDLPIYRELGAREERQRLSGGRAGAETARRAAMVRSTTAAR